MKTNLSNIDYVKYKKSLLFHYRFIHVLKQTEILEILDCFEFEISFLTILK